MPDVRALGLGCAILGSALLLAQLLTGCGASAAERADSMHAVLNATTDVVDPLYESAEIACDAAEAVVVHRQGTTEADDREDFAAIREHCDRAFAAFEAVREAQQAARVATELARSEDTEDALARALEAVGNLRRAAEAAAAIWREQRVALEGVTGARATGSGGGND